MSILDSIYGEMPSRKTMERFRNRRAKLWSVPEWQANLSRRLTSAEEVKREVSQLLKPFQGP